MCDRYNTALRIYKSLRNNIGSYINDDARFLIELDNDYPELLISYIKNYTRYINYLNSFDKIAFGPLTKCGTTCLHMEFTKRGDKILKAHMFGLHINTTHKREFFREFFKNDNPSRVDILSLYLIEALYFEDLKNNKKNNITLFYCYRSLNNRVNHNRISNDIETTNNKCKNVSSIDNVEYIFNFMEIDDVWDIKSKYNIKEIKLFDFDMNYSIRNCNNCLGLDGCKGDISIVDFNKFTPEKDLDVYRLNPILIEMITGGKHLVL